MSDVITYSFKDNFIEKLSDFLYDDFYKKGKSLERVACCFGGKRPALFLRKALSRKIKTSYIGPSVFSIDEFINYTISPTAPIKQITSLDSSFLIYSLAKKHAPDILKGRDNFAEFLPWAREIISFIEQIDCEDVESKNLVNIEKSADIGYEIPDSINALLKHIIKLRKYYHQSLSEQDLYSRGTKYLKAKEKAITNSFDSFDKIIFCNFFYINSSEAGLMKAIRSKGKGIFIFQGSQDDWSVLGKNAKNFGVPITCPKPAMGDFKLYQAFDIHSQVAAVNEIVKAGPCDNTVIVLPRSEVVIPLLTQVNLGSEFNVSMGYPLRLSPLYALFNLLAKAQENKKNGKYYTRDYLNVLRHPLIKNLKITSSEIISRVLIHKLEESLCGFDETSIGGSLFLSLDEIEAEEKIFLLTKETLSNMKTEASIEECRLTLKEIHSLVLRQWEGVNTFVKFAENMGALLDVLVDKSILYKFAFNSKVINRLYGVKDDLENLSFCNEHFQSGQLWDIFGQFLQGDKLSFSGSPLRGMQVLGLFETRSLNFDNVIIVDANESVLPKLKIYEPLIPREVMLNLGLNRLEKEEEIQRYQFMRLIASAKGVHLIYEESSNKERSRFIEELIWNKQKQSAKLMAIPPQKMSFEVKVCSNDKVIEKTPEMVQYLRQATYSASRINTYLSCPLNFYYNYCLGLKEKKDSLDDPQASTVGTFIHELLEDVFSRFLSTQPIIDKAFRVYFFKRMDERFKHQLTRRMKSDSFLLKKIMTIRMNKFLDAESKRNVKRVICLEKKIKDTMTIMGNDIEFVYTADRVDELGDDSIVIIDYKTGASNIVPKKLKALEAMEMTRPSIKENIRSFQLPLYYYFTEKQYPERSINAELYNLRTTERKPFISDANRASVDKMMQACNKALECIFSDIFDINVPFVADKNERRCRFCPFTMFCE
ncbi:MAG: hypothetical protein GY858_04130 [Candidatus Omnitrophica bacterium]|nr:hypothetical protein [Candidatus Omnitrophota bacterium]